MYLNAAFSLPRVTPRLMQDFPNSSKKKKKKKKKKEKKKRKEKERKKQWRRSDARRRETRRLGHRVRVGWTGFNIRIEGYSTPLAQAKTKALRLISGTAADWLARALRKHRTRSGERLLPPVQGALDL
jgi:hypothetical protein